MIRKFAVKWMKYVGVGRISLRNHLVYVTDFLVRAVFLIIILYIFTQLWSTTFRGEGGGLIAGYTMKQMIWYLIFTETLATAFPNVPQTVEAEVKNGDIAYRLTRPFQYVLYHYASYLSETAVRAAVNLGVGGMLGLILMGWPHFGFGWLGFAVVAVGSVTVNFLLKMILALCAFWVEETQGLDFVYNKILFTIGGMLLPLEIYPEWLQRVCHWLPFPSVLYVAARTAVRFDAGAMVRFIGIQLVWVTVLSVLVAWVYARGVRKLNVNGG